MNWTVLIIAIVVLGVFFGLKNMSFVSADVARKYLAAGALVIDVRTPQEFSSGHVPGAISIPLHELHTKLPSQVPDKSRPLLLHCLSGGRSAIAARKARGMGYTMVFNLGSFARARRIGVSKEV